MNSSLERLIDSVDNLEKLINNRCYNKSDDELQQKLDNLADENLSLKAELDKLKQDYQILKETSKDVMNELNHSIEVIEDYFKKQQDANNKDIKS